MAEKEFRPQMIARLERELEQADYQISLQNNEIIDKALQIKELKEKVEQNKQLKIDYAIYEACKIEMNRLYKENKKLMTFRSDDQVLINKLQTMLDDSLRQMEEKEQELSAANDLIVLQDKDIEEIKRQWREDRNQRKNELLK